MLRYGLDNDLGEGAKAVREGKGGSRAFKQVVAEILKFGDLERIFEELSHIPYARMIGPLFSSLLATDPLVKWMAVSALGSVVSRMAEEEMESARVIMRRLMWQLNDESGGIGWGCPETMGEIMARSGALAGEYAHVLRSYAASEGNFIEYEPLQEGVLWALGRLAQIRPTLVRLAFGDIFNFVRSGTASVRGIALWALSFLDEGLSGDRVEIIRRLCSDDGNLSIFNEGVIKDFRVGELAGGLLRRALASCH